MANISFYGSHNGAYAIEENGQILVVTEFERLFNYKNSGIAQYKCPKVENIVYYAEFLPKFLMNKFNIKEFDTCYHLNTDVNIDKLFRLEEYIPAKKYVHMLHHEAHAAGCFYQSPFADALIFSFDGGGNDGKFNVYLGNRDTGITLLKHIKNPVLNHPHMNYDLGFPYMLIGHYLKDIKFEPLGDGNLVYPGKLMGLASYGKVREEWLPYFMQYYKNDPNGINYEEIISLLGKNISLAAGYGTPEITFDVNNRFEGQLAWDIAATSQRAFEQCFLEVALPYMKKYPDHPICITGGCGLNILLNTRIVNEYKRQVFVGPNPNDCGVAVGMLLNVLRPKTPIDLTYSGLPLLDLDMLPHYLNGGRTFTSAHQVDIKEIATDLFNGRIIGVARGRSEHGPRALGNRSILCNPSISEMKDILNAKVKHREWYRPFAPVVRLEDVNKYFEWEGESRWMSFCPKVREEWREKLAAITHVDGTARVQTVTRDQNEWLYELLTEFEKLSGVGVLLNTSFNVNGKPILSSIYDAFEIFESSEMDALIIENTYIKKRWE
jgi:carbamoyltransferase